MKINKGVIAAAGRGTRFLPTTKAYPKELIPILAKPNIQYLVEEMLGAGIDQIAIVHRPGDTKLKDYFSPDQGLMDYLKKNDKTNYLDSLQKIWEQTERLEFVPQTNDLPYGNGSPILATKEFIDNQNFVFMYGDDLVLESEVGNFLSELINTFDEKSVAGVAASQEIPWEEIARYSSIEFYDTAEEKRIKQVKEKLPRKEALSNETLFGRFVFSNKLFEYISAEKTGKDNELWLTDMVNEMAVENTVLAQPIKQGKWLTTGDPIRWLKANIEFGLMDSDYSNELKDFLDQIDLA